MGETLKGIVERWSDEEGWGVIAVDGLDGTVWAHHMALDGPGFRTLAPGDVVALAVQRVPGGQDGHPYSARWVRKASR